MKRPVFSFRPNLKNEDHRKAWEILQSVPEGQKNNYLVKVVLQDKDEDHLEFLIRRAVREEIGSSTADRKNVREQDNLPGEMMEFLLSMEQEG